MNDGFYILTVSGGYSPYVIAGWVVRHDDLLHVLNSRVIRRFGSRAQIAVIAKKGPQTDTQLLDLSTEEWVPVTAVGRAIPANPKAWKDQCPRSEHVEAVLE